MQTTELEIHSNEFKANHPCVNFVLPFLFLQMTMADMMCYCALENPLMEDNSLLSSYPKLQALRNRVMSHLKMSPYLKKRSSTEF